jgi:hypothetical protein
MLQGHLDEWGLILLPEFKHPIRMPVAPGRVLDDDFKPRDEGRVLRRQRVNWAEIPLLVEETPYIAADLSADRLFRIDGGQSGFDELARLALRDGLTDANFR